MALNLNSHCRARLKAALADALRTIQVDNGMFVNLLTVDKLFEAEPILPQNGRLHEELVEYIGDTPFAKFVLDIVGEELWLLDKYQRNSKQKLTEVEAYCDPDASAQHIVDQFETLPWEYRITVPLPKRLEELLRPAETEFELSPSIRVVRLTEDFGNEFPLATSSQRLNGRLSGTEYALLGSATPSWDYGNVCLQFTVEGYISPLGNSATSSTMLQLLRSVFGMGLATRLFGTGYEYSFPRTTEMFAYVHRRTNGSAWQPTTRYALNDAVVRGLRDLKIEDFNGELRNEHKPGFVLNRLRHIGAAFRSSGRAEPTILAAQWLFDSYATQDPLLSFVQSMVVLEIILGDRITSDEIGIGNLIANRFAYLVGKTHDERNDLIADFKKIYAVRSQIVHSGKPTLTLSEQALFHKLRWMCHRAIDKEIDILKAGIKEVPFAIEPEAS